MAAAAFFATNTLSVAAVIALTEGQSPWTVWRKSYFWTFPNYLVGAAVAWAIAALSKAFGWHSSLLLMPVLYVVYRSHSSYITRLEHDKNRAEEQRAHAEEVAQLNRRAIETLALAIEAKDQTTHDHLQRVEVYAIEVAREMGQLAQRFRSTVPDELSNRRMVRSRITQIAVSQAAHIASEVSARVGVLSLGGSQSAQTVLTQPLVEFALVDQGPGRISRQKRPDQARGQSQHGHADELCGDALQHGILLPVSAGGALRNRDQDRSTRSI